MCASIAIIKAPIRVICLNFERYFTINATRDATLILILILVVKAKPIEDRRSISGKGRRPPIGLCTLFSPFTLTNSHLFTRSFSVYPPTYFVTF